MAVITSAVITGVAAAYGGYEKKRAGDRQERAIEKQEERAKAIQAEELSAKDRERKKQQRLRASRRGGLRSTILTTTNEDEDSERKALLGG